MSYLPLADWNPAMDRLWRRQGRRLTVPISRRAGWTIHHSAGSFGAGLDYARWVADFHYHTRGWRRPGGYNFFIPEDPPDGLALEMCGLNFVGAHAAGHNTTTVGVCFQGSFGRRMPNAKQLDCFARLASTVPVPNVQQRHRDVSGTACPGGRLAGAVPLPVAVPVQEEKEDIMAYLSEDDQKWLSEFVAAGREREESKPQSLWHVLDWLRADREFFARYFRS